MESGNEENVKNGKWYLGKIFTFPLLCIEAIALMTIGEILGMTVRLLPKAFQSLGTSDAFKTGAEYAEFWGIWLSVLLVLSLVKKNRPVLTALGRKGRGNTALSFLIGIFIGFGMNGLCVLLAVLRRDISLTFSSFNIVTFLLLFVAVFIQSGAEELVCRGFLYHKLRKEYKSPLVAVIGNSLFFASLHIFNDGAGFTGILNTFVIALFFSLIVYYTGSFWCVAAVHTSWNFTQNILFGLPNSGSVMPYSVFKLEEGARDSFLYNTAFGIEGALFSSLVIIVLTLFLILYAYKHNMGEMTPFDEQAGK